MEKMRGAGHTVVRDDKRSTGMEQKMDGSVLGDIVGDNVTVHGVSAAIRILEVLTDCVMESNGSGTHVVTDDETTEVYIHDNE